MISPGRTTAFIATAMLHVGAVALALTMKGPQPDAQQQIPPIQMMLMMESGQSRPAAVPVLIQEITLPQVVMPIVSIDLPVPAPTAITVVAVTTPAPPPVPAPASAPVADGDVDSPIAIAEANWVRKPEPVYPRAARQARAQGVVHVRATVDINGHAREVRVHRSSGFAALDRAACESVFAALFRPYLHNGMPRSVDVIVPITFALARGGRDKPDLQLDVGGEDHHAMRGHPEELGGLGAASLHVGE